MTITRKKVQAAGPYHALWHIYADGRKIGDYQGRQYCHDAPADNGLRYALPFKRWTNLKSELPAKLSTEYFPHV